MFTRIIVVIIEKQLDQSKLGFLKNRYIFLNLLKKIKNYFLMS